MIPNKYDIFLKVWQTKSFTKTGEYYQYTQSAISQTIRSLEKEMGVTLFHRTTNGVILTFDGERLLPAIQEIALAHTRFFEKLGNVRNDHVGHVRLGGYISLSCYWIPLCVKSFREQYPHITFEFYQEDDLQLLDWLRNGVIDYAFMCNPKKKEFDFYELFEDPFILALPEDYPLPEKDRYSLKEFEDNDFISLDIGYSEYVKKMFKDAKINSPIKYRTIDDSSTLALVEQGFGVSLLPKFVTTRTPFHVKMIQPVESCSRHVGILSRKRDIPSWSQQLFYQFVKEFKL